MAVLPDGTVELPDELFPDELKIIHS
jgi:hypothetical protein